MTSQELQLTRRILRRRITNELHLVELVRAQDAASVLPRGSRLTPEAWCIGDEAFRQHVCIEDLVSIEIGDRHLGGGNEEEVLSVHRVGIVLEFRELAGAGHRRAVDEDRRPDLLMAM